MANHYVKFMRGNQVAYNTALNSGQVDSDTLYFISDENNSGKLYLGTKLISSTSADFNSFSISDLSDVLITEGLSDRTVLAFSQDTGNWENVEFSDLVFRGAFENAPGVSGFVPAPAAGDVGSFLCSNGDWLSITEIKEIDDILKAISNLETQMTGIKSYIQTEITNELSKTSLLSLKKCESYEALVELSTSQGADKYIYLIPNEDLYDEYIIVDGSIEKIGDTDLSLDGYVTDDELNTQLSGITTSISQLKSYVDNKNNEINNTIVTNINQLNETIGQLQSAHTGYSSAIDLLNQNIATLQASDTSMSNAISDLYAKLTWIDL